MRNMTWDQIQKLSDEKLMQLQADRCRMYPYDTSEYSMMLARELRYRKRHGRCGGFKNPPNGPSLRIGLFQQR